MKHPSMEGRRVGGEEGEGEGEVEGGTERERYVQNIHIHLFILRLYRLGFMSGTKMCPSDCPSRKNFLPCFEKCD